MAPLEQCGLLPLHVTAYRQRLAGLQYAHRLEVQRVARFCGHRLAGWIKRGNLHAAAAYGQAIKDLDDLRAMHGQENKARRDNMRKGAG